MLYGLNTNTKTTKFLIGISPQGVITFISKAWDGRTSDKYLNENSVFK